MGPEIVVGEVGALARALVDLVSQVMREAAKTPLAMALPGGSTAEILLPALATAPLDWSRWDFFWSDERAVAPDHPDSNYGLGQRLFLGPVGADARRVHRMKAEADLEAAAKDYEAEMVAALGDPPALDLVLMGVGPDGHVCSLFPGHEALRETTRQVVVISDSPKPPPRRLTFSLPVLAAARVVCVAAFGEGKAEVLEAALEHEGSRLPVARVARRGGRTLFLLDPAAAARLSRGPSLSSSPLPDR